MLVQDHQQIPMLFNNSAALPDFDNIADGLWAYICIIKLSAHIFLMDQSSGS